MILGVIFLLFFSSFKGRKSNPFVCLMCRCFCNPGASIPFPLFLRQKNLKIHSSGKEKGFLFVGTHPQLALLLLPYALQFILKSNHAVI